MLQFAIRTRICICPVGLLSMSMAEEVSINLRFFRTLSQMGSRKRLIHIQSAWPVLQDLRDRLESGVRWVQEGPLERQVHRDRKAIRDPRVLKVELDPSDRKVSLDTPDRPEALEKDLQFLIPLQISVHCPPESVRHTLVNLC